MSAVSWPLSFGTSMPRSFIAAHIFGPWFHIRAANSVRLTWCAGRPRSGPTWPPLPATAWQVAQLRSVKSFSPLAGVPGTTCAVSVLASRAVVVT